MYKPDKKTAETPAVDAVEMLQLEVHLYPVAASDGYLDITDCDKAVTFKKNRDDIIELMANVYYWLAADKETNNYDAEKNWVRIGRKMFDPSNYRLVEFNVNTVKVSENKVISSTAYNPFEMDQICEEAYEYYLNEYSPYADMDSEDDEEDDDVGEDCPRPGIKCTECDLMATNDCPHCAEDEE